MQTEPPVFSVIIPAFNEALIIADCIGAVRGAAKNYSVEIIVADGGSSDRTREIAAESGARIVSGTKGRGYQLNAGAHAAGGDIFVFLHADTRLPPDTFDHLSEEFNKENVQIGTFRLRFDIKHWILSWYVFCSRLDSVLTRFGDHCLAVRREFFYRIAGYPHWPLFEEIYFMQKARTLTKIHLFVPSVTTSGRRFLQNGIVRQYFFDALILARYLLGASPYKLAAEYDRRDKRSHTALMIFARYPHPGKVKTRLAKETGPEYAALFYRSTLKNTLHAAVTAAVPGKVIYLFVAEEADIAKMRRWGGNHIHYFTQQGRNLGERMLNAFQTVFGHRARQAIILGTDIPDLSDKIIQRAEEELKDHDAVIGPAADGGYYLLGIKKFERTLFTAMDWWSTPEVFTRTIARMRDLKLQVAILPTLRDIDTIDDLKAWQSNSAQNPPKMPKKQPHFFTEPNLT